MTGAARNSSAIAALPRKPAPAADTNIMKTHSKFVTAAQTQRSRYSRTSAAALHRKPAPALARESPPGERPAPLSSGRRSGGGGGGGGGSSSSMEKAIL